MRIVSIAAAVLALLGFGGAASTQDSVQHAPTIEQCRADEAVWTSKINSKWDMSDLNFPSLETQANEMDQCRVIDPQGALGYFAVEALTRDFAERRMGNFLQRHNLGKQFLDEDAAGQR